MAYKPAHHAELPVCKIVNIFTKLFEYFLFLDVW